MKKRVPGGIDNRLKNRKRRGNFVGEEKTHSKKKLEDVESIHLALFGDH